MLTTFLLLGVGTYSAVSAVLLIVAYLIAPSAEEFKTFGLTLLFAAPIVLIVAVTYGFLINYLKY